MAYSAGDTILDDEYNTFVNSSSDPYGYNHFAGTGAGSYGLGQTHIGTVVAGDNTVTASSWNSLFTGMDNIANHTNTSITASSVTAGDTIAVRSALITDLANLAAAVAGGSTSATAISESSELQSSVSSTRWVGSHTVEHSITFSNNADLRHFFNAGGTMRMKLTRNGNGGSGATSKDSSVDELITACGNFDLKAQVSTRSGSGESLTDGLANGAADLDATYTQLMILTQSSGTYTSMNLKVEAKTNNTDYTDATVITMKYSLIDPDSGDGEFTNGNTSGVDQYANFIGQTDFALHTVNPTTAQGLASVAAIASSAVVSNTTA
jgi:hypothetical protein